MEHISFPSINQYRQVVKNVRSGADYHGVPYPKDVMGIIATTAKKFWFEALNKEAGL